MQAEITVMSCFSPSLIIYRNALIATPHILKNGVEPAKCKDIIVKTAKRAISQKARW